MVHSRGMRIEAYPGAINIIEAISKFPFYTVCVIPEILSVSHLNSPLNLQSPPRHCHNRLRIHLFAPACPSFNCYDKDDVWAIHFFRPDDFTDFQRADIRVRIFYRDIPWVICVMHGTILPVKQYRSPPATIKCLLACTLACPYARLLAPHTPLLALNCSLASFLSRGIV